jgi:hypothetical protein
VWSFALQKSLDLYIPKKIDMIYLRHTTEPQVLYIPKTKRCAMGDVVLRLTNTINLNYMTSAMTDGGSSSLYHTIMVSLSDNVAQGEYEYTLSDEVGVLSTGLLVIGDLENPTEYNKEIKYEQYTE